MNPDLEFLLERAFAGITPTSTEIGRVVIEPDYDAHFDPAEETSLRNELEKFLASLKPDPGQLQSFDGDEKLIGDEYPLLKRYLRRISLHADPADGDWVEVMSPGNWI